MNVKISCCGVICSDCPYYPDDCAGCEQVMAKPFWLAYTGETICRVYECCIEKKQLAHCGTCASLPCAFYFAHDDPTKTPEENERDLQRQLEQLQQLP